MASSQTHLIAAIETLRQCGFFESSSGKTNDQIATSLLENLRNRTPSEHFFQEYPECSFDQELLTTFSEPANAESYKTLAKEDGTRVWYGDLEADVFEGNQVYERVVAEYAALSMGYLQPTTVTETWLAEEGPVMISLTHEGRQFTTELPYYDDWIAGELFTFLDDTMRSLGFPSTIHAEVNQGQDAFLVRATELELTQMKERLGWIFDLDELPRE